MRNRLEVTEILPDRLWLGNMYDAANESWLKKTGITTVFNCTKSLPFATCTTHQYRLPVDDNLQPNEIANMTQWSQEVVYKVISELKAGHRVLLHCHAGMQRSAAVCAMVLMTLKKEPAEPMMDYIREKRSIAFMPSPNFIDSIRAHELWMQGYKLLSNKLHFSM